MWSKEAVVIKLYAHKGSCIGCNLDCIDCFYQLDKVNRNNCLAQKMSTIEGLSINAWRYADVKRSMAENPELYVEYLL